MNSPETRFHSLFVNLDTSACERMLRRATYATGSRQDPGPTYRRYSQMGGSLKA